MTGDRKPPVTIPNEGERPKKQPGELSYTSNEHSLGSKGGMSGKGTMFVLMIGVLIASIFISYTLSSNNAKILEGNIKEVLSNATKTSDDLAGQIKRIDNLVTAQGEYAKKAEVTGKLDKSTADSTYATKSAVDGKIDKAIADTTYATITSVKAVATNVTTLQEHFTANNTTIEEGVTSRWTLDVFLDTDLPVGVSMDWSVSPKLIEDEDTYTVKMTFTNENLASKTFNTAITLYLVPKEKITSVDTEETFAESVKASPSDSKFMGIDWEGSFKPESLDDSIYSVKCRRIEFLSDSFALSLPTATQDSTTLEITPGTKTLTVDFDIVYAHIQ